MAESPAQDPTRHPSSGGSSVNQATAQSAGDATGQARTKPWNTKKFHEEYEVAKSRLVDQKFPFHLYSDPLMPRMGIHPKAYPSGVTIETEEKLKALIAQIRAEA